MRKLISTAFLSVVLASGFALPAKSQSLPTLYGTMIYSDDWWNGNEYGVYSIDLNGYSTPTYIEGGYFFNADGGAAYFNGTYVILHADASSNSVTYYEFDTEYWDQTDEDELPGNFMGLDFAYDPTTDNLYGICPGTSGLELAIVDFPARKRTTVAKLSQNLIALAINSTGKMYGITGNGKLVTVDKTNGNITEIGSTGIYPEYMQSATFDLSTDKLYWAASFEDDMEGPMAGIYEVDLTTGRAKKVKSLNSCEQFVGLYCLNMPQKWDGPDHPKAPLDVTSTFSQNGDAITANISWSAPDGGIHNGEVDPAKLTYKVVRMPENLTVADKYSSTSLSDSFKRASGTTFTYYVITPYNGELEGEKAETERYYHKGSASLPYKADFTDSDAFNAMATIDGDRDGYTWGVNTSKGCAVLPGAPFEYTNDYLLTPEFTLSPERLYKVEIKVAEDWAGNYPYSIAALVGTGTEASGYTSEIFKKERIDTPEIQHLKGYASVETPGDYRIAVRGYGIDIQNVCLQTLWVEEGPLFVAPEAPASLSAAAGEKGSRKATLTFTAPDKDINGNSVGKLTAVNVYRDGEKIATLTPTGSAMSYTDENPTMNAVNTYSVAYVNENGEGLDSEAAVYVGIDTPLPPSNLRLTDKGNKVEFTWDAPTVGINGGYIAPETLVYTIYDPASYESVSTKDTRFEITLDNAGEQGWFFFYLDASNDTGTSERVMSNPLVSGTPYSLPFYEGFPEGGRDNFWGTIQIPEEGNYGFWAPQYNEEDADGNNGYISFSYGTPGNRTHLFSGKIDISKASNPILDFQYVFKGYEGEYTFDTYVVVNGNDTTLVDQRNYTQYHESWDYNKVRVSLKEFKNSDYIQILFDGYCGDDVTQIRLDAIEVRDLLDNDLAITLSSNTEKAQTGDKIQLTAKVKNVGSKDAGEYEVILREGTRSLEVASGNGLQPDETKEFSFEVEASPLQNVCEFTAEVIYEKDMNEADNISDIVEVAVTLPVYPAPQSLEGTEKDGTVTLTWDAPEYADFSVPAKEGAEKLEDLSSDLGEWKTVDADGANTVSYIYVGWDAVSLPCMGSPMGFVALNPEAHDIYFLDFWDEPTGFQPSSGDQIFVAFANDSEPNDDWLISPELCGEAQTISFNVKGSYSDQYEVLYSATDDNPESFVSLRSSYASTAGTMEEVDLPEGAKYFAIRYITESWGSFLNVDDIVYRPLSGKGALKLEGYNVWCDYKFVASIPETSMTHNPTDADEHIYHVTALYGHGESSPASVIVKKASCAEMIAPAYEEVARYSLEGFKVGKDYKGLVIIVKSDGSTEKRLVK